MLNIPYTVLCKTNVIIIKKTKKTAGVKKHGPLIVMRSVP